MTSNDWAESKRTQSSLEPNKTLHSTIGAVFFLASTLITIVAFLELMSTKSLMASVGIESGSFLSEKIAKQPLLDRNPNLQPPI